MYVQYNIRTWTHNVAFADGSFDFSRSVSIVSNRSNARPRGGTSIGFYPTVYRRARCVLIRIRTTKLTRTSPRVPTMRYGSMENYSDMRGGERQTNQTELRHATQALLSWTSFSHTEENFALSSNFNSHRTQNVRAISSLGDRLARKMRKRENCGCAMVRISDTWNFSWPLVTEEDRECVFVLLHETLSDDFKCLKQQSFVVKRISTVNIASR